MARPISRITNHSVRKYQKTKNSTDRKLAGELERYRLGNDLTFQELAERICQAGFRRIHYVTLLRAEAGARLQKRTAFILRSFLDRQTSAARAAAE